MPEPKLGPAPDMTPIEEIAHALRVVQRIALALPPSHRQGLLVVALERALAIAEHYDASPRAAAVARKQCPHALVGVRCILPAGHNPKRGHRTATGQVWT